MRRRRLGWLVLVSCLLLGSCSATTGGGGSGRPAVTAPVVVVGVGGLTWDAVSPEDTPRLWELLVDGSAAGAATVRQIGPSCPVDGWLSLSSGRATAGPAPARDEAEGDDDVDDVVSTSRESPAVAFDRTCGPLPEVRSTGGTDGSAGRAFVPEWRQMQDLQDTWDFEPEMGLLADSLAELDVCATAVGPGAALALADADGVVDSYRKTLGPSSFECPVTVVDAGVVVDRARDLAAVDRRVADVLDSAPVESTVLITGMSEQPGGSPELAAAFLTGPSVTGPARYLVTSSTRWDGVVRLLDVPSTLLAVLDGSDPAGLSGAPIRLDGERPASPTDTVEALHDITRADQVRGTWTDDLRNWLGGVQLLLYAVALVAVGRRWHPRGSGRAFTALVLCLAATPLAAFLVTFTGWWRAASPDRVLWGGLIALAAALAVAAGRLPQRPLWWATGGLSLLTYVVLAVDALIGTPLHRGSLLGPSPARGGRYFGFGNETFCVFVVVALLLAGAVAAELLARGRRRQALGSVIALGLLTILIVVWPNWGANVGGGLALLPGITLLALVVARVRVTAPKLAGAALAGVVLVGAVAFGDWLRPERDRSHSGRFVQEILDGDAWAIIARKAGYAQDSLSTGVPAWLTIAVLVASAAVLTRPERFAPSCLLAAFTHWPTLRASLGAILLTIVLGSFVNDYGLRIATISLTLGLPLVALTCARANGLDGPSGGSAGGGEEQRVLVGPAAHSGDTETGVVEDGGHIGWLDRLRSG
jgi:hypothetical protein